MGNIIRVAKDRDHPYTIISKRVTEDTSLSWEARGVMAYLMGKPDGWQVSILDLTRHGPSGITKMERILKELEEHGYLRRRRLQDKAGRFYWVSEIDENGHLPFDDQPPNDDEKAPIDDGHGEDATYGKPTHGEPANIVNNVLLNNAPEDSILSNAKIESSGAPNTQIEDERAIEPLVLIHERVFPEEEDGASVKKKRRSHPERNPLLDHPAIRAYRSATGRYPPKVLFEKIVSHLGDNPDVGRIRELYADWVAKGRNPTNIKGWLFERYRPAHAPQPKQLQGPTPQPPKEEWQRIDEHTVIIPIGGLK